jgi:hypothetical protein
VEGVCVHDDESSGSGATELVSLDVSSLHSVVREVMQGQ